MDSIQRNRTRVNSGELREIVYNAGFSDSTITRLGENALRVELNDPQGITDPGTFSGSLNLQLLTRQISQLHRLLDSNPTIIPGDSLQTIFLNNQESCEEEELITIQDDNAIERKIIERGCFLGDNRSINNLIRLKRDTHFYEELSNNSYRESVGAILSVMSVLKPDVNLVKDKDVIIFVGPTRSGKSTTMLYLDGTEMQLRSVEELGIQDCIADEVIVPANSPSDTTFIGHATTKSHTFFPRLHTSPLQGHPNLYLVDFPGLLDTSGWQVRIGLDIILRDIIRAAKSVRLMAILDRDSFTTTAGNIAKGVVDKLKQIDAAASDHTLVGITRVRRALRPAFIKILEGHVDTETNERRPGIIEGFDYLTINQADSTKRQELVTGILNKTPVGTINSTVVSPDDLMKFTESLNKQESINYLVRSVLSSVGIDPDNNLSFQTRSQLLTYTSNLYNLSSLLSDNNVPSLLGHVCGRLRSIIDLGDHGLTRAILNVERRVADTIFRVAVGQFNQIWEQLINIINGDENLISRDHKTLIEEKFAKIRCNIDVKLDLKNIQFRDCEPETLLQGLTRSIFDLWLSFLSPLIYLARAGIQILTLDMEAAVEGHINPPVYERALQNVRELHQDIQEPYKQLIQQYHSRWLGEATNIQRQNVNYTTIDILLESGHRLINGSFARGAMIDGFVARLTQD